MKKWNKLTIFLIPIGIAVNAVGGQLALALKLPVFLDCIGTFVTAALCGIGPGLVVAVGTQLINAITTPTVLAYIEIGMLFAVISYFFAKWGIFKSRLLRCVWQFRRRHFSSAGSREQELPLSRLR